MCIGAINVSSHEVRFLGYLPSGRLPATSPRAAALDDSKLAHSPGLWYPVCDRGGLHFWMAWLRPK